MTKLTIGILSLQGDVIEHQKVLQKLNVQTINILHPDQLKNVQGLILPGGESTTQILLLNKYNLKNEIINLNKQNKLAIFATCAGVVLLAKEIKEYNQDSLKLLAISVKRNATGRQKFSFETDLQINVLGKEKFKAVFIRAPYIEEIKSKEIKVLAEFDKIPVLIQQKNILASSFHPELTSDLRVHKYFIENMCYI